MKIAIRRGLDIALKGAPVQQIGAAPSVGRVALAGADYPGLRPELLVAKGDAVEAGAPLLRDRRRPGLVVCAPVAGTVEDIVLGARRRLALLVLSDVRATGPQWDTSRASTPEGLRALLLEAGLWPALRARPFERIPDPDATPDALFVTAIDTAPHAPDPAVVLAERLGHFQRGVEALTMLTDGPVHVCQGPGPALIAAGGAVSVTQFSGPHPAGLPGTHIARLFPLKKGRTVWHINYQDVAAIGGLIETGTLDATRVIALSGPGIRDPRLVRVPLGADLHALSRPGLLPGQKRIVSGSALSGRESRFLGRYHLQATVLDMPAPRPRNWLFDALYRVAAPPAFIPTQALEQALGVDLPVVPLLRALSIGDAESAAKLGALHLAEEDLALATYATGATTDFGARLRAVLDILEPGA